MIPTTVIINKVILQSCPGTAFPRTHPLPLMQLINSLAPLINKRNSTIAKERRISNPTIFCLFLFFFIVALFFALFCAHLFAHSMLWERAGFRMCVCRFLLFVSRCSTRGTRCFLVINGYWLFWGL